MKTADTLAGGVNVPLAVNICDRVLPTVDSVTSSWSSFAIRAVVASVFSRSNLPAHAALSNVCSAFNLVRLSCIIPFSMLILPI
jgi:hypothetical protein